MVLAPVAELEATPWTGAPRRRSTPVNRPAPQAARHTRLATSNWPTPSTTALASSTRACRSGSRGTRRRATPLIPTPLRTTGGTAPRGGIACSWWWRHGSPRQRDLSWVYRQAHDRIHLWLGVHAQNCKRTSSVITSSAARPTGGDRFDRLVPLSQKMRVSSAMN